MLGHVNQFKYCSTSDKEDVVLLFPTGKHLGLVEKSRRSLRTFTLILETAEYLSVEEVPVFLCNFVPMFRTLPFCPPVRGLTVRERNDMRLASWFP